MNRENNETPAGFDLRHFERNRYFQGKLMSASDMVTDQQYHIDRLQSLTKLSTGTGIIAGLGIDDVELIGDELQVTIDPGLAVDSQGRPIVVRNPTTRSFSIPDGDRLYLYIGYDTETKDPVPVPGSDPMSRERSEDSRILEVFSLTMRETPPNEATTPLIDLSGLHPGDNEIQQLARELATTYHDTHRAVIDTDPNTAVFLGAFELDSTGQWTVGSETNRRPLVYDNEMLFSMLVSHIDDSENPHNTHVDEPKEYIESELDQMEKLSVRIKQLRSDLSVLSETVDHHTEYATRKSLKTTIRFFDDLATSFENQSEISRHSLSIVESIRNRFTNQLHNDEKAYIELVEDLLPEFQSLIEELDDQLTPWDHDRFAAAVDELSAVLDKEPTVIAVATALDSISEAIEMADKQARVVSESGS